MSYGGSLLSSYPSTLVSDQYVHQTNFASVYPSSMSYLNNNNRLIEDGLNLNRTRYQPTLYNASSSTAFFPSHLGEQHNPSGHGSWRSSIPGQDSHVSMNDVTEYSESMGTASNTNTASSVARTIEDPYQPQIIQPKINNSYKPGQTTQKKPTNTNNTIKDVSVKKNPNEKSDTKTSLGFNLDNTNNHPPNSDAHIQAWLENTNDDKEGIEQEWSRKVNQMHITKAQRIQEKNRSTKYLGSEPKKLENKTRTHENSSERRTTTYMDSLFDGDYFKPISSNNSNSTSFQSSKPKRTKPLNNSFSQIYDEIPTKATRFQSKKSQQTRLPHYEPPTVKRAAPQITTSSWRTNWPNSYVYDSWNPYYYRPDLIHPELVHKDEEERFREALQALRAERAEQKSKQMSEATAKRLTYGDYVRASTKEGSLQNPVKPSPWSDFMDMKKGNVYHLSREEKKQLYNQSKSYGERVRHRNIGFHSDGETPRSTRYPNPLVEDYQESESGNLTPRQIKNEINSKSVSQTGKGVESISIKKRNSLKAIGRTSVDHRPDESDDVHSDSEVQQIKAKRLTKKKSLNKATRNVSRLSKSDSSPSDTDGEKRSVRFRLRPNPDQLFTVREERTLESIEGKRTKKNNVKQRK